MITLKANQKLIQAMTKFPNKIKEITAIVVASNVLIEDINKKGELIIKHI